MNDDIDLWKLCIHESSHATIAIVLGGRCTGVATYNGMGGAHLDGLTPRRHAIATAAGPAAEVLAGRFPVPAESPAAHRKLTVDEFLSCPDDVRTLIAADQARQDEDRQLVSDDRTVALWAITAHEKWPETWADRVADVHRAAAELVEQNAAVIIAVAAGLFAAGVLDEDQILDHMNGVLTC